MKITMMLLMRGNPTCKDKYDNNHHNIHNYDGNTGRNYYDLTTRIKN